MKKELKSGILSADKSADHRPTVGGVNVITVKYRFFICKRIWYLFSNGMILYLFITCDDLVPIFFAYVKNWYTPEKNLY